MQRPAPLKNRSRTWLIPAAVAAILFIGAVASNLVAGLLRESQPHASQDTRDALDRSPMMLAVPREALAIRRPGTSVDDILERIALRLRPLIDTSDALRRGVEAALSRWREPGPC